MNDEQPTQATMLSPGVFEGQIGMLAGHTTRANAFALEQMERFPRLRSVSVTFGANFGLQFAATMTFERPAH